MAPCVMDFELELTQIHNWLDLFVTFRLLLEHVYSKASQQTKNIYWSMVICNNFVQVSKILCNRDGQTKWLLRPSRTTIMDNISHLKSSRIASLCPPPHPRLRNIWTAPYDAVSDVVESGVHWRSDFQIGSRVLKICFKPIFMHIYGMQYDFMHRSCWNHSNFENSWFYNVISTSDPQNHCLLGSRNRVAVNFLNRYVIYWVVPCERARPELSEYVWQRGVGSL